MEKENEQDIENDHLMQITNLKSVSRQLQQAVKHAQYLFKGDNWVANTICESKEVIDDAITNNNFR